MMRKEEGKRKGRRKKKRMIDCPLLPLVICVFFGLLEE